MTLLDPSADPKGMEYTATVVLTVTKQDVADVYPIMCGIAEMVMTVTKADLKLDDGVAIFIGTITTPFSALAASFYGNVTCKTRVRSIEYRERRT